MIQESVLEKYRSGELDRSLKGLLVGMPVALVVNSGLLVGLLSFGQVIEFNQTEDIPIEIVVTDAEEPKIEPEEPPPPPEPIAIAEPPPEPVTIAEPNPLPQPKAPQPESKPIEPKPVTATIPNPTPFTNLLNDVLPGATESEDGDTETPASPGIGSSFSPGSGDSNASNTSEFADRLRRIIGNPSPPAPTAALPEPPPPPVENKSRFGCVECPKPSFPSGAKERGVQGEARVSVDVDARGNVIGVRLLNSSGHPELDQAAIEQARRWRFTPSESGKQGVSARVDFQIEGTDYQRQAQERQRQRQRQQEEQQEMEMARQRQQEEKQRQSILERPVNDVPSVSEPARSVVPEAPVSEPTPARSVVPEPPPPPPQVFEPPPPPAYEPPPPPNESMSETGG